MKPIPDLINKKFNKLTVIGLSALRDKQNKLLWECQCDCGNIVLVRAYNLKYKSVSCGCLRLEKIRKPDNLFTQKYNFYKRDALKRKLGFNLNLDQFKKLIQEDCFYCGEGAKEWNSYIKSTGEITNLGKKMDKNYVKSLSIFVNGIDRIDNKKDYNIFNCVPCCSVCNMMKKCSDFYSFVGHIEKIFKHLNKKIV